VEKARREIVTMKKLNGELERELEEWSRRATAEQMVSNELEEKIALRTAEVQQKKMDEIHQKAHLIKDYDAILKKLERELGKPSANQDTPSAVQFYLTDPAPPLPANRFLPPQSPKSKKTAAQVAFLK
jgi:Skp family chaperone for outer membrane proteins